MGILRRKRSALIAGGALAAALVVGGVGTTMATTGSRSAPQTPDEFTPLTGRVIAAPHPAPTADGRVHLVYELELHNALGAAVDIQKVEALDATRRNAVVVSLSGADLRAATRLFADQTGTTFTANTSGLLYMDVTFAPGAPLPAALTHRIMITLIPPPTGALQPATTYLFAPTDVARDTPVRIAPPLSGKGWVDSGGCCPPTSYHRTTVLPINGALHDTQRYAIDFVQLNKNGRLFEGPKEDLSSYDYFGTPIHAVADGVVVRILDGQPEQVPGGFPPLPIGDIDGNFVVMDIGGGHYAFYAHFQAGLKVRLGQRVRQGQVLGYLGNTGNSDGPHLHFHVMDGPSPLGSNGLPYTFTRFRGDGYVTNLDALPDGATAVIDPNRLSGWYRDVLPSDRQVVVFLPIAGEPGHRADG
jgi:hypothetical protein